ncbi:MAG TPA: tetratricopeptide repeat protein [Longimicrobiales bacterium]|nr:tetratricopeptide repeat protein [Longimicrobiales bacterium]
MSRVRMILALVALGTMAGALPVQAQEPSDNRFTRSVALYLRQADDAANPEDKNRLYEQAIESAQEGLEDGSNPKLLMLLGRVYAALGRTAEAADVWDRAIDLYPPYEEELARDRQNAWVRSYNAAVNASRQGDNEAAVEHYKSADMIFQGRPEAKLNLGNLMAIQGEDEQAIEYLRGALEIMDSEDAEQLRERDPEAFDANRRAAVFNLAQVLARADRREEAVEAYQEYLEHSPEDMIALGNLGVVLSNLGRDEEVADLYGEALERDDLTAADYFRLGLGLFEAERYEQAQTAFEKSLDKNPYDRDARYNLANTVYARARAIQDELVEAGESPDAEQRAGLIEFYGALKEHADALAEVDPQNESIVALQAQAARSLSDLEEDQAASDALRAETSRILERRQSLAYAIDNVSMEVDGGYVIVTGTVVNINGTEGDPVTLHMVAVDESGAAVAEGDVTINLPAADATAEWEAEMQLSEEITPAGWRYEVAG